MADLMPWISGLQARGRKYVKQYLDWLVSMSKHPARTRLYFNQCADDADLTCGRHRYRTLPCHWLFLPWFWFLADSLP